MAWRRPGDKPLSEPVMVILLMHILYESLGPNELIRLCLIVFMCPKTYFIWLYGKANTYGSNCGNCFDYSAGNTSVRIITPNRLRGPLFLTRFRFDPSMDKQLNPL